MKRALLIVDPRLGFMSGGTQEIPTKDRIIHVINSIMTNKFDVVVVYKPNTSGSEFHPNLKFNGEIFTGDDNKSILTAINSKGQTIHTYFKKNGIDEIYVAGILEDKYIEDISYYAKLFKTIVIINAMMFKENLETIIRIFISNGITIINSKDLKVLFSDDEFYENTIKEKEKNIFSSPFDYPFFVPEPFTKYAYSIHTDSTITKLSDSTHNDDINEH
jgi:hypothetical protein